VSAEHLGELIADCRGELSGKLAKDIFPKMFSTGEAPSASSWTEGLKQISDTGALEKIVAEVIAAIPSRWSNIAVARPR
jgi:aspartyl-tRNA(Asn)/glutamyl-tRNA(Gln) amidotransferase subunit B